MKNVRQQPVFKAKTIAQAGVVTSEPIDLRELTPNGIFSFMLKSLAGAGNITITYSLAEKYDGTYVTPSGAVAIATAKGASDDPDIFSFEPELAPWMKIIATENNAGTITELTGIVFYQ